MKIHLLVYIDLYPFSDDFKSLKEFSEATTKVKEFSSFCKNEFISLDERDIYKKNIENIFFRLCEKEEYKLYTIERYPAFLFIWKVVLEENDNLWEIAMDKVSESRKIIRELIEKYKKIYHFSPIKEIYSYPYPVLELKDKLIINFIQNEPRLISKFAFSKENVSERTKKYITPVLIEEEFCLIESKDENLFNLTTNLIKDIYFLHKFLTGSFRRSINISINVLEKEFDEKTLSELFRYYLNIVEALNTHLDEKNYYRDLGKEIFNLEREIKSTTTSFNQFKNLVDFGVLYKNINLQKSMRHLTFLIVVLTIIMIAFIIIQTLDC